MKNEREKEIEHVNPLNRHSGGLSKQRDKARQQITDHQQQNANISISGPHGEIKKQRETYKKLQRGQQRRKNGIGRIK
jgi:hypothetical protein